MKLIIVLLAATGIYGSQLQFSNNLPVNIRVMTAGNSGMANLNGEGITLAVGSQATLEAPDNWSGKIWAVTGCNEVTNICTTGSTGATSVQLTFKESGEVDSYSVSTANGFNVGVQMQPIDGQGDGSAYSCQTAACGSTTICSGGLQINNGGVSCITACGTTFTCSAGTYRINFGG